MSIYFVKIKNSRLCDLQCQASITDRNGQQVQLPTSHTTKFTYKKKKPALWYAPQKLETFGGAYQKQITSLNIHY